VASNTTRNRRVLQKKPTIVVKRSEILFGTDAFTPETSSFYDEIKVSEDSESEIMSTA